MKDDGSGFDAGKYKQATREQWNASGAGYDAWGDTLERMTAGAITRMLELAGVEPGGRVLELAAGTGRLTLRIARRVVPGGVVLATDLSPDILALARANAREAGLSNMATQEMDGERLDVDEGSFDAVLSSLGLMFFPDPVRSLGQQLRAAKPGGKVAALVISTPERNPFFAIPAMIIRERAGLPPPPPGAPGPFALGTPDVIAAAFERAGLREVATEHVATVLELASADEHVRFLRDAFGALHLMMAKMSEAEQAETWESVGAALERFQGEAGYRCPGELLVCVGTR